MEIEKHQKFVGDMNRGAQSRVVMGMMTPHLDALEKAALIEIKQLFRSGQLDPVKMFVKVGQLCNLDDIRERLSIDIRKGEYAGKELNKNETASQ